MSTLLRRAAWKLRSLHSDLSETRNFSTTGLYGFDHLKTPKGFRQFVDEAIQRSGELVNNISVTLSSAEIIRAMDEISNTVCCVVDSAELCRNTHPDREFVEEANKASMRINEYLHYLNTNHTLYDAVKRAEQDGHLLTKEAQKAAHHLRIDFEKGGIHLSSEKLDRVNQLNMDIFQLSREFSENISIDPGHVDIYPASRIPKHIHHLLTPIHRFTSGASGGSRGPWNNTKEKGFQITTDPRTLVSVLQWASDDEVRKIAYIKGNSVPHANIKVLDKLIAARHELAQIMGYKSYAEFMVKPNLASSPKVVTSFLNEMSQLVRPKADKEFEAIRNFKKQKCGKKCIDLEPWDEAHYTGMMKSSAQNLDSSIVASYFPLAQCIEGLKVLVNSLFGATFHNVPMAPGESWHPDVLKMAFHHPEEGDLGYLYLDLYSRKGKYPGCANFAIKGGCRFSETDYQLPVVALVCNFSGSRSSSNVRLNHWEVETLFHEFGHALHSLFSRTDYQHFSGTRVVLDFAEMPSNLFEYYAWDYRVLRTFAKHYSTGEIIPEKLVKAMQGARDMFSATELQRQVFYALVDQTLFGEQPASSRDTSSIVADLKRQHTSWKHVEGTHWQIRFSHLVNYGADVLQQPSGKSYARKIHFH
ncbi:mitochondrial intermediate peptidase, mitochondrial isoform X2 [Ricinus communis]|uniref:mitochondrial intermediate peptidase, mitochondrial isoform X2 n=1 Tax=Ricinus communis TaxID=3988 RepID=UPI000772B750|nr:mitochondrial intermediate peptidase, mitochondrial isoform X2 [Ricinus communis]|eukprot:XP_015580816.1 mitochondrial intermediate peptidase, mitochondrial isoform X2 [Ricinus communis]